MGPRAPTADQEDYPLPSTGGLSVPSAPGRLVEAYDVLKPVGKGGYAIVYKGIRREDGRVVAVKKVEVNMGFALIWYHTTMLNLPCIIPCKPCKKYCFSIWHEN